MRLRNYLKRTVVIASLLAGMLFPTAVQAETEVDTQEVSAYVYDMDHRKDVTLAFRKDLPTIPYINATDYLNTVYIANDFSANKLESGSFAISAGDSEYTMTVDPAKDAVTFSGYSGFINQKADAPEGMQLDFLKTSDVGVKGGEKPASFDLSAYDIDILEINGEVYLPLQTMNDIFMHIYNGAEYLDGNLYFIHFNEVIMGKWYYDRSSIYEQLERSGEEAGFNYNELCFMMDTSYGAPTRSKLADEILEEGFDRALETSDKLKRAKNYLQSENLAEYILGLYLIGDDLHDGGHMIPILGFNMYGGSDPNSKLVKAVSAMGSDPDHAEDKASCAAYTQLLRKRDDIIDSISAEKVAAFSEQYTVVKQWDDVGAALLTGGDTAIFTFDKFELGVVEPFKWSVDKAAELGMRNFVVDLSTNNGGITLISNYMLALMSNKKRQTNTFDTYYYYRTSDELLYETDFVDLNLDGRFDDEDKTVSYDMNFAILESGASFSTANLMPVRAKELGIPVLGETSGGGSCALVLTTTASGHLMSVSGMPQLKLEDTAVDVDPGAEPDVELSYEKMFDQETLSNTIHQLYGDYDKKEITYHFFEQDDTATMDVIFKPGMPSVPYVDAAEYMSKIMIYNFREKAKDGNVVVSGKPGTFTVDAMTERVTFQDYYSLLNDGNFYVKPGSSSDIPYARATSVDAMGEVKPTTLDLSEYGIDLLEVDGKAYFPLPTISDLFCSSLVSAEYVNGEIYFVFTLDAQMEGKMTDSYADRESLYEIQERPKDAAEFTYKELCFMFDHYYGKPAQCMLAESIRKVGFDKTLETYDETTQDIRNMLKSTDPEEFMLGLTVLQGYMNDGGHTTMNMELASELLGAYPESWLGKQCNLQSWIEKYVGKYNIAGSVMQGMMKQGLKELFLKTRAEQLEKGNYKKIWEGDAGCMLYKNGDTVIFTFDIFDPAVVPWFKKALDYAAENGVKNFIVDLSANGGGSTAVLMYMMAIMKNRDRDSNVAWLGIRDEVTGGEYHANFELDLNLDGKYDAADKSVYYDLNYAVLASPYSFSCGNLLPFYAKDNGILVMGGTSGGGACAIVKMYTADAHFYSVSSNQYFITDSGADVDLGVDVDVSLIKKTGDGTYDYDISGYYDIDALNKFMKEFYPCRHKWDAGKVTKAVTCTKDGVKTFTCTKCGETKTETIKKTGHREVKVPAVAATYTRKGKTAGVKCSVCGEWIKKPTVIQPKTGLKKVNGKLYYYKNGKKQSGWQTVGKKRYFFKKKTKAAATGKVKIGKYYYYFSTKAKTLGQMQTGKVKVGKKYYYFSPGKKTLGRMKTGWVKIGKKYYYFSKTKKTLGRMVTGKLKIGKKVYKFNKNGVCLNK